MKPEFTPELERKIETYSLQGLKKHHIPIPIYGNEMGVKADLLREHRDLYLEKLGYDATDLANEIDLFKELMYDFDIRWKDGKKRKNESALFWKNNRERLIQYNRELITRLEFHFSITENGKGCENIESISGGTRKVSEYLHDGRRLAEVLNRFYDDLVGTVYTAAEIRTFQEFYEAIAEAHESFRREKSAPNRDQILRDKIYLHLRTLETTVMKLAAAALRENSMEKRRYYSTHIRDINRKHYENKTGIE